ncbi:hypothetical protein HB770_04150 [Rhizobium leguminosarum bv. viciae]|uniref:Uncharacterized protein n=1 Tax=Rhizobium leguminosarum bv. viciae TaxID=387 RepID=A0A7G6RHV6_RHILV|nr:hypothetical protein HB770_04150 [Rhizobium leguminosarum bv. viciae]
MRGAEENRLSGFYWQPKKGGRAEEEWACLAYAYAALKGLQSTWLKWRDLNLAGEKLSIPELCFDPVTGEIGYEGEDFSVHELERKAAKMPLDLAATAAPTLASASPPRSPKQQGNSQPLTATVSSPAVGKEIRPPRNKGPIRSSGSRFR